MSVQHHGSSITAAPSEPDLVSMAVHPSRPTTADSLLQSQPASPQLQPDAPAAAMDSAAGSPLSSVPPTPLVASNACSPSTAHHAGSARHRARSTWDSWRRWLRKAWVRVQPHLMLWESRRDLKWLACLFVYFLACMYFVSLANSYADRLFNSPTSLKTPLTDVVLDGGKQWFYDSGLPLETSDYIVNVAALIAICRMLLLGRRSAQVFRRCFFIIGTLFALRAICIFCTVLPSPWEKCRSSPNPNYFVDALLILSRARYACGDVFFSGHTIFFTVAMLLFWTYPIGPRHRPYSHVPALIMTAYGLLGMISLIVTTLHYTIDVIVAFLLVIMSWSLLWFVTEVPAIKYGTAIGRLVGRIDDPFWEHNFADWRRVQQLLLNMHLEEVVIDGGDVVVGDKGDAVEVSGTKLGSAESIPMNDMRSAMRSPPSRTIDPFGTSDTGGRIKGL